MAKTILFVDDEKQILRALKRLFINEGYEIFIAESGQEALELLKEHPADLLVTDIRMPEMDGFELLRHVKASYPLTLRVALSGYTDSKRIFNALDDNLAKLYLLKPWDNNELLDTVHKLFDLEDRLNDRSLLNLINNLSELPTVPTLYSDICKLIEEEANIDEISKKLEEDQSITSRILRVANSAFYGAKTGSISQAIMYIGLANVKNIVLTNGVFTAQKDDGGHVEELWEHVKLTNKLMTLIYQKCLNRKIPNSYASAGLLHDIGRVVIVHYFKDQYAQIRARAKADPNITLTELERELISVDHEKIGGYLLNWWEIPVPIVEAALYHHDPLNPSIINRELVAVVHISNYYAWDRLKMDAFKEPLQLAVFDQLGISQSYLETVIEEHLKLEG